MTASTAASYALLVRACDAAHLPVHAAQPIRLGENALWRLSGGIVARIARPGQVRAAQREIAVGRWLADAGVPAVRPTVGVEQPVLVDSRPVTFWDELPPHVQGTVLDVASLLQALHTLPVPALDLGSLDPFVRLPERIAAARSLNARERTFLLTRATELRSMWDRLPAGLAECVVHGDAWVGNVARTHDGTGYLLDLERASVGRPEWDLVSTAIKCTSFRMISSDEYSEFVDSYGVDVTAWAGYEVMRDVRELRMTTFALQAAGADPAHLPQANYRLRCLLGLEGTRPWAWTAVG